ncbi:hypothetical protein [Glutamicibacter endophyticus]|uniref:hypothetical protein n=1 Tax=Glutamicibacter endophyticus TaxID=1522174 RepID=UPI003AF1646C
MMPCAPAEQVLRTARTGLLETVVTQEEAGARWIHRLGTDAPRDFVELPMQRIDRDGVCWGHGSTTERSYRTCTTQGLTEILPAARPATLERIGWLWGQAVRAVHEQELSGLEGQAPRTLLRAERWITGRWRPMIDVVGARRATQLERWAQHIGPHAPETIFVHGSPGMAHWTLNEEATAGALLTGEDTGLAHPAYDLAWIYGELAELAAFYPSRRPALYRLRSGIAQGYGADLDPQLLRTGISYRLIQHAFDWHHYAGAALPHAQLLITEALNYLDHPQQEERL